MTLSIAAVAAAAVVGVVSALSVRRNRRLRTTDSVAYHSKREAIIRGGLHKLHFIVDFDRTVTTHWHVDGTRGDSCQCVSREEASPPLSSFSRAPSFHCSGIVERHRPEECVAAAAALNARYFPIEVDASLSTAERIPHMEQWYRAVNQLLVDAGLKRQDIVHDVARARLRLREGFPELLRFCSTHGVPCTILSAGIANVIEEVLRQHHGPLPPCVRIVSNKMLFDGHGPEARVIAWSEPVLHMFSKTAHSFSAEHYAGVADRTHVVLVGDGEGDATMADGLPHEVLLKIGLLNDTSARDKLGPRFAELFDTVLHGDAPAWDLIDILRHLEHTHNPG